MFSVRQGCYAAGDGPPRIPSAIGQPWQIQAGEVLVDLAAQTLGHKLRQCHPQLAEQARLRHQHEAGVTVGERRIEVGGPARDAVRLRQLRELAPVAADQDRVGHHAVAVRERYAALGADGDDRADEMLVHAHAAGDAVHDDAESLLCHVRASFRAGSVPSLGERTAHHADHSIPLRCVVRFTSSVFRRLLHSIPSSR